MAQKYVVQVIDDLDGTELDGDDVEEIRFGLDGIAYVIDLSHRNAAALRAVLTRYTDAARRDQASARAATSSPRLAAVKKRRDLDVVRAWAAEHGYTVASHGRVSGKVLDAYDHR